ncbi:MAG: hypothetical protein ACK4PI_01170 [Tepidisphaerales bacterium]
MPTNHLNFTRRIRLTREQVVVRVQPGPPATFDADLDLPQPPRLPESARVFVEAYRGAVRMRFDFGTVGRVMKPLLSQRVLSEFDDQIHLRFRVKVTDVADTPGKILAWANNIKPRGPDGEEIDDPLPWKHEDLDGRVWDIRFEGESGPIGLIDRSLAVQTTVQDDAFIAAVYPEALRRILVQALIHEQRSGEEETYWFTPWYRGYLKGRLRMRDLPDDINGRWQWIEDAVAAFGREFRVLNYWKRAKGDA